MFDQFKPSRLIRPFVPKFVHARLGQHVDTGLDMADAIFAGRDERAQSLRTALIAFTIRIIMRIGFWLAASLFSSLSSSGSPTIS